MTREHLMDVTFPARDQAIAKVISALSEPDAGKAADNFVTNEDSFARVAAELERRAPRDGVTIGVGPDQNFTYIARTSPRIAFVLDFRRGNALLHFVHKALFALSADRAGYLANLTARVPRKLSHTPSAEDLVAAFSNLEMDRARLDVMIENVARTLRPLNLVAEAEWAEIARIQARLAGPGLNARFLAMPIYPTLATLIEARDRENRPAHFLASETTYQTVRDLQVGDRVIPLVGDFAGPKAIAALGAWLKKRSLQISVFYASDVEFFLVRSGRLEAYAANLAQLPWHEDALLIRSSTREIKHPERVPGDSSTTILRPVANFLARVKAGQVRTVDDLFV